MTDISVLHIRSTYFYGGPERQITYLTRSLADSGISSAVVTFAPKDDPDRNAYYAKLRELKIPAHRIEISGSFDRSPLVSLKKLISDAGYTVLVGHDYRADYFVLKLGKKLGLPAISFSRGWTRNTWKVKVYEWMDIRFLKKMDGVVAVSLKKYDELAHKGIDTARMIYIPNSIMLDTIAPRNNSIRARYHIPEDHFLFGTAGRLSGEKNQKMFIEAAVEILHHTPDVACSFIIAGEGPLREPLASLIPEHFRDRIIMAGFIDNMEAFYADLSAFVLTSHTEGFPNVLLEAGRYSLPVITTPAGGAVEIIRNGDTGVMILFDDVDALTKGMRILLHDKTSRETMGNNLNDLVREKFDMRRNASMFVDFATQVRRRLGKS